MAIRLLFCAMLASLSISALSEENKPKSFSYFAIGNEHINYQENISVGGAIIETDTSTQNTVLLSGGRTFIDNSLSFSINAISTLYPNRVTESWHLTNTILGPDDLDGDGSADLGATKIYGPQEVQNNRFSYSQVSTQILMHYHPDLWWSLDAGLTYSLGTFKRFSFNYGSVLVCDTALRDCSGNTVIEETVGELSMQGGGSIHYPITHKIRLRLSALVGTPLISRIENTEHPDLVFDSIDGWNTEITGSVMHNYSSEFSLGFTYDIHYQFKEQQGQTNPDSQQPVYIPENVRIAQRYGLIASWSF